MSDERTPELDLELRKRIQAPAERTFDALSRPELLSKWFTTSAEADLRVGGRYRNGDKDEGEFLLIEPPTRLHFSWENPGHCPGTVVEIELDTATDDAVEVRLRHRGIVDSKGVEDMRRGWSWALESLRSYLETAKPIRYSDWEATQGPKQGA